MKIFDQFPADVSLITDDRHGICEDLREDKGMFLKHTLPKFLVVLFGVVFPNFEHRA